MGGIWILKSPHPNVNLGVARFNQFELCEHILLKTLAYSLDETLDLLILSALRGSHHKV